MRPALVLAAPALLLAALVPLSEASHTPAITRIHQGPCEEQFFAYPLPMAEAMAFAPPGFPPRPFDTGGLSPPVPPLATAVGVGYRCAATTAAHLALGEVRTIGRALLVDPPAHLRAPHIANYVVVYGGITSSPELARIYTGWHLPNVEVGRVSFEWEVADNGRVGHVTGASRSGSLDLVTLVAGAEEAQQPDTFRLFVFERGHLAGYVDWGWPAGARTIESGASLLRQEAPGAAPEVRAGVAFDCFGAYSYDLAYTPLR